MDKFRLLQIGGQNLSTHFTNEAEINFEYLDMTSVDFDVSAFQSLKHPYDLVFVRVPHSAALMALLQHISTPYNTYIDHPFWDTAFQGESLVRERLIRPFHYESDEACVDKLLTLSFVGQYGDRIPPTRCLVSRHFQGTVAYEGNHALVLTGDFGATFQPILTWPEYLFYDQGKVIQIWPEFTVTGNVEVTFTLRLTDTHNNERVSRTYVLDKTNLHEPFEIPRNEHDAFIWVSAKAKGQGTLCMGAFHKRWSRVDMGYYLLGGERYADENREELIYYFDPGDLKPPLAVYFSGYRTAEGFEAYFMMRGLKCPFLLVADPRLEGGAFYLGSESYEQQMVNVIKEKLDFLGFRDEDVILSGMSMGSFGALYYGAKLKPAAIIAGKPLVNIGDIAASMALQRPEDFGTALDLLLKNEGENNDAAVERLNQKFWNQLTQSNLENTTVAITYMEDDDYDINAFKMLLPVLSKQHVRIMRRSIPGRHNDDTPTIASWFINFYKLILESRFGRVTHENEA